MIKKKQIKIVLDIIMSIALLFLMAFQVTGDMYHEWIGSGMLVLFVVHNCLNIGWYKTIFKGKYSAQRILRTLVNLLVLAAIIITGYSGIVMSRFVFDFLPISGGMATARKLHLAGAYWAFVLMSVHLGMHWSLMISRFYAKGDKEQKGSAVWKTNTGKTGIIWLLRLVAAAIAVYGAFLFGQAEIYRNMFLQNEFAILDFETPAVLLILQNLAMMATWVFIGHYLTLGIRKLSVLDLKDEKRVFHGAMCVMTAIVILVCSIAMTPQKLENESWGGADTEAAASVESESNLEAEQEAVSVTETSSAEEETSEETAGAAGEAITPSDEFVLITGGTYQMGSPDSESWRSPDETLHSVTVGDFYMSTYEVTQEEYEAVTGSTPSTFMGSNFPVENVS